MTCICEARTARKNGASPFNVSICTAGRCNRKERTTMKPKTDTTRSVASSEASKPGEQLAATAKRAINHIYDLGFVRSGQGKVRAMFEKIVHATSYTRQRQVAYDLVEKLYHDGNALARKFARELWICGGLGAPQPSATLADGSATKFEASAGGRPATSTKEAMTSDTLPVLDEREIEELRQWDQNMARLLKGSVESNRRGARMLRKDSPNSASQLERLADRFDAERQALNAMAVNVK